MAYTDLTATFTYKKLLTWQLLDQLAENDSYDRIPVGTVKLFNQAAAPTGWTKQTTQTDKALRVTSGAGGGSGGTYAMSTGISLTHSHTVNAHTHAQPNHQHMLDADAIGAISNANQQTIWNIAGTSLSTSGGSGTSRTLPISQTPVDGGGGASGSASPATDSQLTSNVILAYIDVIQCSKN